MTFGFLMPTDSQQKRKDWYKHFYGIVEQAIKNKELKMDMLGVFWSYEFIPVEDDEWQYRINIPSSLKIEPLVITGGIEARENGETTYSFEEDEYASLIEHGWTFATARQYTYRFTPTSFGTSASCKKIGTEDRIFLTDVSKW